MPRKCFSYLRAAALSFAFAIAPATMAGAEDGLLQDDGSPAPGLIFELGAGGSLSPSYEGSSRYELSPYPVVRLKYLRLNNGFQIGGGDDQGLSFRPSFRYIGKRSAADDPVLAGLPVVDASVELGAGIVYQYRNIRGFVDLRYGIGHGGIVGETGVDVILTPMDQLTLTAGPRLSFASGEYMSTYFDVTPAAAVTSGLPQFASSSGFKSYGAEVGARYDFNDSWALEGLAGWHRLIDDAAASPIIALGDKNQYNVKIGLVRTFRVGF